MTKINPKTIIIFDGVIGAGKTSLAKKVSEKLNIKLFEELCNEDTTTLLDVFYKDQKRWSFTLQIHFLNERFRMIKEIQQNKNPQLASGILDRSIFGDRIFADLLNDDGMMTDEEFRTYETLLNNMLQHVKDPQLLVYIDCETDVAMERIKKRNRESEEGLPWNYLNNLNIKYKNWYNNYNLSKKIKLDATSYHPENEEDIDKICNKIVKKIRYNID